MRFVKDVIVGVNERVKRLEQRLDMEYIQSEDYMNFLYKTFRMASNDVRREKLNLSVHHSELCFDRYSRWERWKKVSF